MSTTTWVCSQLPDSRFHFRGETGCLGQTCDKQQVGELLMRATTATDSMEKAGAGLLAVMLFSRRAR